MGISELVKSIEASPRNERSFKELGDVLRDEDIRRSESIFDSISTLVGIVCVNLTSYLDGNADGPLVLENLRVLINLTADVDRNRIALVSTGSDVLSEFWAAIVKSLYTENWDVRDRVAIFLSQFIHNTDEVQRMYDFLGQLDLSRHFVVMIEHSMSAERDVENLQLYVELLAELSNSQTENIIKQDFFVQRAAKNIDLFVTVSEEVLRQKEEFDPEEMREFLYFLSLLLSTITSFEDIEKMGELIVNKANQRMFKILRSIPTDLKDITVLKRRFFAVSGNITSMRSYESIEDLKKALGYVKQKESDPYLLACCFITLGNYVTSPDKATALMDLIDQEYSMSELIRSFFSSPFNDIVQYQAIHLLTNLLREDNFELFLDQEKLSQVSKILIDNRSYYPDVFNINFKFLKKLFRIAFVSNAYDVLSYRNLIELFDFSEARNEYQELHLIALQALCKSMRFEDRDLTKNLVTTMLTIPTSNIDIVILLEKVKTMGIFFRTMHTENLTTGDLRDNLYNSREDLAANFLHPLLNFLQYIENGLREEKVDNAGYKLLCNNSQFVCATLINLLSSQSDEISTNLLITCKVIISIKI